MRLENFITTKFGRGYLIEDCGDWYEAVSTLYQTKTQGFPGDGLFADVFV